MHVSLLKKSGCFLGEGIISVPDGESVFFFDIFGKTLFHYRLAQDELSSWGLHERCGWIVPTKQPRQWVFGFESGPALVQWNEDDQWEYLDCSTPPNYKAIDGFRLNDGAVDARGRIWFGTMQPNSDIRNGSLYCLDVGHASRPRHVEDGYAIPNGPAISPDQTLFLHTDSAARCIYAYDFDLGLGQIRSKRVWKSFTETEGYPDGMIFDGHGTVWVAFWGAACVRRFNQDGHLLDEVIFPTPNITKIAFSGNQFDRLFAISAKETFHDGSKFISSGAPGGDLYEVIGHNSFGLVPLPAAWNINS